MASLYINCIPVITVFTVPAQRVVWLHISMRIWYRLYSQRTSNTRQWQMQGTYVSSGNTSVTIITPCLSLLSIFSYFLDILNVNGDRSFMVYMQAGESMNMLLAGIAHHFCALTTGSVACMSVYSSHMVIIIIITILTFAHLVYIVHALHNTSGGSNTDCVSHFNGSDQWKCIFAPVSKTITFCGI